MPDVESSGEVSAVLQALQDKFVCQLCGKCCRVGGNPLLTDQDVCRIAVYLCCSPANRELIPVVPCEVCGADYFLSLTSPCFFQDKVTGRCMIHPAKPQNCREWPFIALGRGTCDLSHVLVCPEATRLLNEFLGVGCPSECDKQMSAEFHDCWNSHAEEFGE